ncbi:hypothetical protein [uncultured Gammaproteobacteria bacterium]|nr:hypothetical protein [uncultured Gammaproteobacteria bacterium]
MSGHYFFKLLILIVFYYKYGVFWLFFGFLFSTVPWGTRPHLRSLPR